MDLIIAGATVVLETGIKRLHVGIEHGRIASLVDGDGPAPAASRVVDATGLVIVPGAIDAHTHFTGAHDDIEPEIAAGTRGAAKAGVTTVIEMPHANPPSTTLARFMAKRDAMARNATVDFALWGGIDGENLDELEPMHRAGAVAMKGFMCSGRADGAAGDPRSLPMLNDDDLLGAMTAIASFGGLIGLHAENHSIIQGRMRALRAAGRTDARAHAEAQPEIAETEAVARAIHLARATGVRLHIVHMSSALGVDLVTEARQSLPVTVETCPQYLVLDEEDLVRTGLAARCGPPIRPRATVEALWRSIQAGKVDALTSDHCPYPIALKTGDSIWDGAMGLTGIETATPLFFSAAVHERALPLTAFAQMTATGPAKIFGLYGRKGAIGVGFDADLVLIDPEGSGSVDSSRFEGEAKWSAFDGMPYRGHVERALVRGRTVYADGRGSGQAGLGEFVARID